MYLVNVFLRCEVQKEIYKQNKNREVFIKKCVLKEFLKNLFKKNENNFRMVLDI